MISLRGNLPIDGTTQPRPFFVISLPYCHPPRAFPIKTGTSTAHDYFIENEHLLSTGRFRGSRKSCRFQLLWADSSLVLASQGTRACPRSENPVGESEWGDRRWRIYDADACRSVHRAAEIHQKDMHRERREPFRRGTGHDTYCSRECF